MFAAARTAQAVARAEERGRQLQKEAVVSAVKEASDRHCASAAQEMQKAVAGATEMAKR